MRSAGQAKNRHPMMFHETERSADAARADSENLNNWPVSFTFFDVSPRRSASRHDACAGASARANHPAWLEVHSLGPSQCGPCLRRAESKLVCALCREAFRSQQLKDEWIGRLANSPDCCVGRLSFQATQASAIDKCLWILA